MIEPGSTDGMTQMMWKMTNINTSVTQSSHYGQGMLRQPTGSGDLAVAINAMRIYPSASSLFQPGRAKMWGFVSS